MSTVEWYGNILTLCAALYDLTLSVMTSLLILPIVYWEPIFFQGSLFTLQILRKFEFRYLESLWVELWIICAQPDKYLFQIEGLLFKPFHQTDLSNASNHLQSSGILSLHHWWFISNILPLLLKHKTDDKFCKITHKKKFNNSNNTYIERKEGKK